VNTSRKQYNQETFVMVLNTHLQEPMTDYLKGISMDNVMDIINSPSQRLFNSNYINSLQHAKKNLVFCPVRHTQTQFGWVIAFPFQPFLKITYRVESASHPSLLRRDDPSNNERGEKLGNAEGRQICGKRCLQVTRARDPTVRS
jgi:hypothetical protein